MKNFVDCKYLSDHMDDENLIIIDCRFDLFDADYGEKAYKIKHIKNAFFLDINRDFSGKKEVHGGARPLPDFDELLYKLSRIGARLDSNIVIYDDKIYSSPRVFWQLKHLGFQNIKVLNGGIEKWMELGYETTDEVPIEKKTEEILNKSNLEINEKIYCDSNYIKEILNSEKTTVADSRNEERYTGEYEPLYSKKGHIEGAINLHWNLNFNSDGTIKTIEEIEKNTNKFDKRMEMVFYCGSAIEGAINYMVFDELGYNAKLYIGSMSDWITYDDCPVVMGKN